MISRRATGLRSFARSWYIGAAGSAASMRATPGPSVRRSTSGLSVNCGDAGVMMVNQNRKRHRSSRCLKTLPLRSIRATRATWGSLYHLDDGALATAIGMSHFRNLSLFADNSFMFLRPRVLVQPRRDRADLAVLSSLLRRDLYPVYRAAF